MKILIAEEALQAGDGHWPSYIGDIANGLRAEGDSVDVLLHREAVDGVVHGVGGTPWFTKNCWKDGDSQGLVGGIRHSITFYRELRDFLGGATDYDWVFSLTMRLQHLLAYTYLLLISRPPKSTRFLLLFVQGFGQYDASKRGTVFRYNVSTLLAKLCFYLLRGTIKSGQCVIAAETRAMQEELSRFTQLPVSLFPHPISSDGLLPPRQPDEREASVTICAPGFARHEKGSDLLLAAMVELLDDKKFENVNFLLQWAEPFECPDGSVCSLPEELAINPRIDNVSQSLSADEYAKFLERADVILLPYRRLSYCNRLSRVAIEAASKGIPLIYTSDTWMQEIDELSHAAVVIDDETGAGVASAVREALSRLNELKDGALAAADSVAEFYSMREFRRRLPS